MDEKKRKKHKEIIIKEMPHFLRSFDKWFSIAFFVRDN